MSNSPKFEKNVQKILNKTSKDVGDFMAEDFRSEMYCNCFNLKAHSPIEQILYFSIKAVAKFNYIDEADIHFLPDGKENIRGLTVSPQYKINKYRCDFLVTNYMHKETKQLIIECDSQQFHERTEEERRYEKARDRFFVSNGYKVFHYTGSEIIKNHYKIAAEIITNVSYNTTEEELLSFLDLWEK